MRENFPLRNLRLNFALWLNKCLPGKSIDYLQNAICHPHLNHLRPAKITKGKNKIKSRELKKI